jgi:DNA-binding response OmpR family regulator
MRELLLLLSTWIDFLRQVRAEHPPSPEPAGTHDVVQFGEIQLDFVRFEARRSDRPVDMTAMEFKVLKFFTSNPHRVISRDELLDKVWGYDNYPTTRTVDNRIMGLRQKLEKDAANPVHFRTVHGAGYKFVP